MMYLTIFIIALICLYFLGKIIPNSVGFFLLGFLVGGYMQPDLKWLKTSASTVFINVGTALKEGEVIQKQESSQSPQTVTTQPASLENGR